MSRISLGIASVFAVIILLVSSLAGCSQSAPSGGSGPSSNNASNGQKSIVRVGATSLGSAGTNAFIARGVGDYEELGLINEPLAMPMMDGTIQPWLAKSWTYDQASDSWTYKLDERAKWSDGKPVTSEDVKFTLETAFKYDLPLGSTIKAFIKSIDTPDPQTVKFNMSAPFAAFPMSVGSVIIMPKSHWENVGDVSKYQDPNPVGSGPFLYKEFKPGAYFDFVKNPNYWRGPVGVDEVIYQLYGTTEAEVMALKKGEIDIIPTLSGAESLLPTLMSDNNIKVMVDKWPAITYIAPNFRIYPMNVKEFRQAIDLAVDKQAVINTAYAGYGELPLMGYVAPVQTKWANIDLTWRGAGMKEEDRLSKANALLDGLGFTKGSDGVRVTKDGKRLEFNLWSTSAPATVRSAEIVKDSVAKVGIKFNPKATDPNTLVSGMIFSGKEDPGWDVALWSSTNDPDPDRFAREYAPDTPTKWENSVAFGWKNDQIQGLLSQTRREMDDAKRVALVKQAQQQFADELPVMTLFHPMHEAAYRTDKYVGWNLVGIYYQGMYEPLASIINMASIKAK